MEDFQGEARTVYDRPVTGYVGLTLDEARTFAEQEGRTVRVKNNLDDTGRASFGFRRVNLRLGSDGRVVAARKDRLPPNSGHGATQAP